MDANADGQMSQIEHDKQNYTTMSKTRTMSKTYMTIAKQKKHDHMTSTSKFLYLKCDTKHYKLQKVILYTIYITVSSLEQMHLITCAAISRAALSSGSPESETKDFIRM